MEYMCVHVKGPRAGRALLGSSLSRWWRGHVPSCLPPPTPPPPLPPHSSLFSRAERAGTGQGVQSKSLPSPCHLAPGRCKVPARRAWGPGPRQVHKLTLPSPPRRWEQARSPHPPWRGGGPRVAAPPTAPPSSRSGPPRAVIG